MPLHQEGQPAGGVPPTKAELQELAEQPLNDPRVAQQANFEKRLRLIVNGLDTRKFCIQQAVATAEALPCLTVADVKELVQYFFVFASGDL